MGSPWKLTEYFRTDNENKVEGGNRDDKNNFGHAASAVWHRPWCGPRSFRSGDGAIPGSEDRIDRADVGPVVSENSIRHRFAS
jgi:hypothetical protein